MPWRDQPRGDPIAWLLDPDSPGIRYLILRDLLDLAADDPELQAAQRAAHTEGPIATILNAMHEEGYWVEPSPAYNPKYRSTVWSLIMLAQLSASAALDERIGRAPISWTRAWRQEANSPRVACRRAPPNACKGTCAGRW